MSSEPLSSFEAAVLEWMGARSGDVALREQLSRVRVLGREHTGVGCHSRLVVPAGTPRSTASYSGRGPLTGPCFEAVALRDGGGTLLWFKNGRPECLEVFAYGNYFPADHSELGEFELSSDG